MRCLCVSPVKMLKNGFCVLLLLALFSVPVRAGGLFSDVADDSWYASAVRYAYAEELMLGTGSGDFAPALELNRAMAVTVLHRLAGSPETEAAPPFTDVPADSFYAEAVAWGYEAGIVTGTGGRTFTPGRSITRQELVTLFYRFTNYLGQSTDASADPSGYADAGQISDYAVDAFRWAVGTGLVNGVSENRLDPQGTANRAQFAVLLYRFAMPDNDALVLYLRVLEGVATDLVTGKTFPDIAVADGYLYGGKITLPQSYTNWTYEMIVDYNEESDRGIIRGMSFVSNNGQYEECSDIFKLRELERIDLRGQIRIPWVRDAWTHGYNIHIPVQVNTHVSADYEYLPEGDSFWSFSMDSDNGILNGRINGSTGTNRMGTWVDSEGNTRYVDRIFTSSFSLHADHAVKELRFYDRPKTESEQAAAYAATGITPPTTGISRITDGLTDLGSSYAITRVQGGHPVLLDTETESGTYSYTDGTGRTLRYTIRDYIHPDNGVDNSGYESVHITNPPGTLEIGTQYPLTALPYPFRIIGDDGKADAFDVVWSTEDSEVLNVIDGLLIAKQQGTVQITAALTGTDICDSVTITVTEPEPVGGEVWQVPSDYVSPEGDTFSETDYAMTTRAIYAAIAEAGERGIEHILFPQQHFCAQPITDERGRPVSCQIPSGLTVEFPEGSVFHMMDNPVSRGDPMQIEIHYFLFGVPNSDYTGACVDSHLIIDTYYGERYQTQRSEREFLEENRFVSFGRKAIRCSVEIRDAYSPAGYFIAVNGTSTVNKTSGVLRYGDFVSGRLDDSGTVREDANWISTPELISVPDYGTDDYFLAPHGQDSYGGKYWSGCSARLYDILWYDASGELLQIDRFQGRGEYYGIPDGAAWCRVSLQQSALPVPESGETEASPWLALHDSGAARMCQIKNTRVYDSACGIFSVVGQTDGLWVHGCYTNRDGKRPGCERTGDFENGWLSMRHSVVSNCLLNGYFGAPGGYNTFIHTNFLTNYSSLSGDAELLRYLNNTTDYVELSEKSQAHIYYNTVYTVAVDRFMASIGHVYSFGNKTGEWVRSY